eukprot:53874_1
MSHDKHRDTTAMRSRGLGAFIYQMMWPKGGQIDKRLGWDYAEHLRDDIAEFPEMDLDWARSKAWTVDLDEATNNWYKCRRQKGVNSYSSCLEEGESLRRAHWKHQLQLKESGCEKPLFAYAKCIERNQRKMHLCRRFEIPFIGCIRRAGNMNLVPQQPLELRRREHYSRAPWIDIRWYNEWIRRRDTFLEEHPDWFEEEDIEIMSPKQLYKYIKTNKPWLDRGDTKPYSTFAYPQRYREYVPKKK